MQISVWKTKNQDYDEYFSPVNLKKPKKNLNFDLRKPEFLNWKSQFFPIFYAKYANSVWKKKSRH